MDIGVICFVIWIILCSCSFDYVSILDAGNQSSWKRCGNWTGKEKLLSFSSETNEIQFHFVSDFSVNSAGFFVTFEATTGKLDSVLMYYMMI